jgi:hypothetical protein
MAGGNLEVMSRKTTTFSKSVLKAAKLKQLILGTFILGHLA